MENEIKQTCKMIEKDFYKNKHWKKKMFLNAIKSLSLVLKPYEYNTPNTNVRAMIIRLCYMYFREIDDLIDGDKLLPNSSSDFYENKKAVTDYMQQRRLFLSENCMSDSLNNLDEIIKTILDLSLSIGLDLKDDSLKLLDCMLFDLARKCDLQHEDVVFSSKKDIDKYFFEYYYDSCIKIAVLVTSSNPNNIDSKNIMEIGSAQRIYFNLIDFFEDMSFGIINIPMEDIQRLGISSQSLIKLSRLPKETIDLCKNKGFNHQDVLKLIEEPIIIWLNEQLNLGLKYLESYQNMAPLRGSKEIMEEALFNRNDFSDIVLRLGIERGTNNYLKMLSKNRRVN